MPLYEYKCLKCGRRTEKIESMNGPHLKKCPHCGGKVESMISAPAIQFKGSGWYVTDYAGKSTSGGSKEKGADKDEKPSSSDKKESSSKDSSSTDSGSKDSGSKDTTSKDSTSSEKKSDKSAKKK